MPEKEKQAPRARLPQFGVAGLMLVTLVCCVTATAGYYFLQSLGGARQPVAVFILFTFAAPVALLVAVSAIRAIWLTFRSRK